MHATREQRLARCAGLLYLLIIGLGLFGELGVRMSLVQPGDAAATAARIQAEPLRWRLGLVGDLLMHACDVGVMLLLYTLLAPRQRLLGRLALGFNALQTAVLATNKLLLLLPLLLLGSAGTALGPPLRDALLALAIRLHAQGLGVGLLFFAVALVCWGLLIGRAAGWPRWLGPALQLAGLCYGLNSLALLLQPRWAAALFPWLLLPCLVAELGLALHLLGLRRPAAPARQR